MKLAVVGSTGATPARVEELLWTLIERRGVDAILPVGAAQGEVQAVMRGRDRRFPVEVPWTSPEFADFVLTAVLEGYGAEPAQPEEQRRNVRLHELVRRPGRGALHVEEVGDKVVVVVQDEAQVPSDAALSIVAMPGPGLDRPTSPDAPPRLRPGGLAPDGRLVGVELEAVDGALEVRFIDSAGEVLRVERV